MPSLIKSDRLIALFFVPAIMVRISNNGIFVRLKLKRMLEYLIEQNWDALKADLMIRIIVILLGWGCVIASAFVDLWSGVDCAKTLGKKIQSNGFRRTVTKIGDYFRVLIFGLLFDLLGSLLSWYDLPYATMVIALSCVLIEAKSVIENSRRKKSKSAEVLDMARMIVNATNLEQAKNIIRELNEQKEKA